MLALLLLLGFCSCLWSEDVKSVTFGSTIKLIHKETKHHLHSHNIAWGSGSGQQSVTATGSQNDPGSLWIVKEAVKSSMPAEAGELIPCGTVISLEHVSTGTIPVLPVQ